jgi:hypothetical protein
MYFIVNTTSSEVIISDLYLSIKPKQGFDLDSPKIKRTLKIPYLDSKDLSIAIKKGIVKVIANKSSKQEVVEDKNSQNLDDIKKMIQEVIKENLPTQIDQSQIIALLEKTHKLIESKTQVSTVYVSTPANPNLIQDENDGVDEKTLNKIHAQSVDKLVKNAKNKIEEEETLQKVDKTDITKNVSELEELL